MMDKKGARRGGTVCGKNLIEINLDRIVYENGGEEEIKSHFVGNCMFKFCLAHYALFFFLAWFWLAARGTHDLKRAKMLHIQELNRALELRGNCVSQRAKIRVVIKILISPVLRKLLHQLDFQRSVKCDGAIYCKIQRD